MYPGQIPVPEIRKLAERFEPDKHNPSKWLEVAPGRIALEAMGETDCNR